MISFKRHHLAYAYFMEARRTKAPAGTWVEVVERDLNYRFDYDWGQTAELISEGSSAWHDALRPLKGLGRRH